MTDFADRFWTSRDGLKLHYRDYAGRGDRPPVLCLPGLTRNARDFEDVAVRLAGEWRVICVDLRGRGESAYAKDSASYNPLQYADDLRQLFVQEGIARAVFFGTSLGGLITMITALTAPQAVAGVLLNDVGPELNPIGIDRIRTYVGQGRSYPTWMHAARALEESQGEAYPDYAVTDWLAMAKRCMAVGSNGRIHFDYDMKIAEPLAEPAPEPSVDMWPAIAALAGVPSLLLRGAKSDVLSAATHEKMGAMLPLSEAVTVPGVGHAPMLDEPEAVAAIDRLLARVA
ncbi:pimeloyl-ACP methyl ester carboxylesterase [Novosphingobium kunmingense]|uniref:Pimeloyl-ACP methyl ester carboxylesterase n=1 Tax=Novosphingobium kunmingense TaxID=1211806 RepID=A0A2N0I464_9SPHN|nr:alpha/beta hydrolase [Novosphingobium kunmingense]PKB25955.1 pimeloyl-ACP methyl ester carboxylesterase [Novosphingobium kunmingense]